MNPATYLRPMTVIAEEPEALARFIDTYNDENPDLLLAPLTLARAAELMGRSREAFDAARSRGHAPAGARPLPGTKTSTVYYPSTHAIMVTPCVSRDPVFLALRRAYPFGTLSHRELLDRSIRRNERWFDAEMSAKELGALLDLSTEALRKAHGRGLPEFETRREAFAWFADHLDPSMAEAA